MNEKLSVRCENFRRQRSNTLFGFVDLVVPALRLRIREATVHEAHGKRWVGLPAKPQIDRAGSARRDDRGKIQYTPVLQFLDREVSDAFSSRAIEALIRDFPDAFASGDGSGQS
jgi:hypothetical protein